MKNSPVLGFLGGLIVILLIIIFSLGYQLNKAYKLSLKDKGLRIEAEEKISKLEEEVAKLKEDIKGLNNELKASKDLLASKDELIEKLKLELEKMNKLKEKLEDNLKEELMKSTN